jgi:hypothetical protein
MRNTRITCWIVKCSSSCSKADHFHHYKAGPIKAGTGIFPICFDLDNRLDYTGSMSFVQHIGSLLLMLGLILLILFGFTYATGSPIYPFFLAGLAGFSLSILILGRNPGSTEGAGHPGRFKMLRKVQKRMTKKKKPARNTHQREEDDPAEADGNDDIDETAGSDESDEIDPD